MKPPQLLPLIIAAAVCFLSCATSPASSAKNGSPSAGDQGQSVTAVSLSKRDWNWFFLRNDADQLESLRKEAGELARDMFGSDVVIESEALEAGWNPLSLLMLFGTLGNVEDYRLTLTVRPPSPPPPEPDGPPSAPDYAYRIIPRNEEPGNPEFIRIEYIDRKALIADLETRLEEGTLDPESFSRKLADLPSEGLLTFTLGRKELDNAISKWFSFRMDAAGKPVFSRRGREDIPYVYGDDRLWWNMVKIPVSTPWGKEAEITVSDGFQQKTYRFTLLKEFE